MSLTLICNRAWMRAVLGTVLIAVATVVAILSVVDWRADSAATAGDWARAISWRPDIALYHRRYAEMNLIADPPLAYQQAQLAAHLDPYNPKIQGDLAISAIALHQFQEGFNVTRHAARENDFYERWRYANLLLSEGDLAGFWRETAAACHTAHLFAEVFPAVVDRALTASHFDFATLYTVLPHDSDRAAEAYLRRADNVNQAAAAERAFGWLAGLAAPIDPGDEVARQITADEHFLHLLRADPPAYFADWNVGVRNRLALGPARHLSGELLVDNDFEEPFGSFDAPTRTDARSRVTMWLQPVETEQVVAPVYTGDVRHGSALALSFDGNESEGFAVAEQYFLAPAGSTVRVSVTVKDLREGPAEGLNLRVLDRFGGVIASLPLPATNSWKTVSTTLMLGPGQAEAGAAAASPRPVWENPPLPLATHHQVESYRVQVYYHRPLGEYNLANTVLLTEASVQLTGLDSKTSAAEVRAWSAAPPPVRGNGA